MTPADVTPPGGSDALAGERAASAAVASLERVTAGLPAGEARPQQVEMCRAVATAVERGRHLVVQAGTGTGKSLGYLVPSALSGRKVVVATATKALQDQLAGKDLPTVAATLGQPLTFAVLKGRSNYLCRQRAGEIDGRETQTSLVASALSETAEPDELLGGAEPPSASSTKWAAGGANGSRDSGEADPGRLADQVRRILDWSNGSTSGDRADLPFEPHERAWAMLSVGPRECPGAFRCPSGHHCFAEEARARAAAADVIVVNTHLYGAHLASGGAVLPAHDVVVFDEAHEVEEVMTASLGVDLTPGRFRALAAMARSLVKEEADRRVVDALGELADRLAGVLAGRLGQRVLHRPEGPFATGSPQGRATTGRRGLPGSESRLVDEPEPEGRERTLGPPPARASIPVAGLHDAELVDLLGLAASRVDEVMSVLRRAAQAEPTLGLGFAEPQAYAVTGGEIDGARQARALNAAGHLANDLARFANRTDDEVAWVGDNVRSPVLHLSPIDVGPPLAGVLWGDVTAILTSATIPPRLSERLGLVDFPVDQLDVGSPFDYRDRALLYVARHLPDRRSPDAETALHEELAALITAAGGRTLALFTSRRATDSAVSVLRQRLPYRLLVQGELPKGRLLADFAEDEESCLFATLGFWQGVDIPGPALSLVTVDKLPFSRPDDPLLEARRERVGEAAFRLIDLPRAATLLAQGAGRLIRTSEDRGVVAVLDPRLATAGYRAVLLAALPPMRRTTDRRQVVDFLRRSLSPPGPPTP